MPISLYTLLILSNEFIIFNFKCYFFRSRMKRDNEEKEEEKTKQCT